MLTERGVIAATAESDVQGFVASYAGEKPYAEFVFGGNNVVTIDATQIHLRGKLWAEIPSGAQKVLIEFRKGEFSVEFE